MTHLHEYLLILSQAEYYVANKLPSAIDIPGAECTSDVSTTLFPPVAKTFLKSLNDDSTVV